MKTVQLSLRVLLPLLLLVMLAGQSLYLGWYTYVELQRNLQVSAHEDLRLLLTRMQGTLGFLTSTRQYDQIHAEVTGLGSDYTLIYGMLLDDDNQVLASTHLADLTLELDQVLPASTDRDYLHTQIDTVRVHRHGLIWTDSNNNLTGAYPIQLSPEGGELRPQRMGVLIVSRDLHIPIQQLGKRLQERLAPAAMVMSLFVLGIGVAMHWLVTRRMRILVDTAERGARGDYRQNIAIQGRDEIAQLARTLENMFKEIDHIQQDLQRSQQRYVETQRAGNVGIWDWEIGTDSVHWSDTCEDLFGYERGGFPGTFEGFISRVHPEDRQRVQTSVQYTLETDAPYKIEFRLLLPDGNRRWILAEGSVERDTENRPARMFGTVHDITERKQVEEALRDSETELRRHRDRLEDMVLARTAELEAVITELESFSYSVSHDLRAPLRAIAGFSDVLLEDYAGVLDDTGRHYLDRIRNGAERMANLIDDLLNLSRVTRGGLQREPIDMGALIEDVIREQRRNNPALKTEFVCHCTGIEQIDVDQRLVRILVSNLISNAIKFSSKAPAPRIECGVTDKQGEQVYYVRDNGVGFDEKYADKLFTPFHRMHNPADFEGTGIGLATARRVIRRHGGRIWAESRPGKGAVFYFSFGRDNDGESVTARIRNA